MAESLPWWPSIRQCLQGMVFMLSIHLRSAFLSRKEDPGRYLSIMVILKFIWQRLRFFADHYEQLWWTTKCALYTKIGGNILWMVDELLYFIRWTVSIYGCKSYQVCSINIIAYIVMYIHIWHGHLTCLIHCSKQNTHRTVLLYISFRFSTNVFCSYNSIRRHRYNSWMTTGLVKRLDEYGLMYHIRHKANTKHSITTCVLIGYTVSS